MRITKSSVDKLKPSPPGEPYFEFDDELKGFGVRVSGDVKSYIVQGRVTINGKTKKVRRKLGSHGVMSTEQARNEAKKILGLFVQGVDPYAKASDKQVMEVTLRDVFEPYKKARRLRPKTISVYEGALRRCFSDWLDIPITQITKKMVQDRHQELSNANGPRGKGEAQANQAMRVLRSLLNYAASVYEDSEGRPIILENPVKRLSQAKLWNHNKRRHTMIDRSQLAAWWRGVSALENDTMRDFFHLCLLTGLRRNEAATLRWEDIDLQARTLRIKGDRTKNHEDHYLPLSDFLEKLLKRRKRNYLLKSEYVFPGRDNAKPIVEVKTSVAQIKANCGVQFMTHDLRRTFLTIGESLDIPYYALKRLANHKDGGDVTSSYIKSDVERLRAPMQLITDTMVELAKVPKSKTPKKTSNEPFPIDEKRMGSQLKK